jgi:hypothetical protein
MAKAKNKAKKRTAKKKELPTKLNMSFEEAIELSLKTRMPDKKRTLNNG